MAIGTPTERRAITSASAQTTTTVFSPATTIAAGKFVVLFATSASSKVVSSVADSVGGNTWVVDATGSGSGFGTSFASCQVVTQLTSSDTITITWSAATSALAGYGLQEVTGIVTSSAFDKSKFANGSTNPTAPTTGASATLGQADEIVFGLFKVAAMSAWAAGSGYSDVTTPFTSACTTSLEYKIVAATTAVTADGVATSGTSYMCGLATYKGAAADVSVTAVAATATPAAALAPAVAESVTSPIATATADALAPSLTSIDGGTGFLFPVSPAIILNPGIDRRS